MNNMEQRLKNIIVYHSWFDIFENKLTDEQIGKFMKAIGRWKNGGELFCDDPKVEGVLITIEKDLNDMLEHYKNKVETNRENGKKGGRPPKTQSVIKEPNLTQKTQSVIKEPTITQPNPKNLKDRDIEIDRDIDRDIDNKNTSTRTSSGDFLKSLTVEQIKKYNNLKKQLTDSGKSEEDAHDFAISSVKLD